MENMTEATSHCGDLSNSSPLKRMGNSTKFDFGKSSTAMGDSKDNSVTASNPFLRRGTNLRKMDKVNARAMSTMDKPGKKKTLARVPSATSHDEKFSPRLKSPRQKEPPKSAVMRNATAKGMDRKNTSMKLGASATKTSGFQRQKNMKKNFEVSGANKDEAIVEFLDPEEAKKNIFLGNKEVERKKREDALMNSQVGQRIGIGEAKIHNEVNVNHEENFKEFDWDPDVPAKQRFFEYRESVLKKGQQRKAGKEAMEFFEKTGEDQASDPFIDPAQTKKKDLGFTSNEDLVR